MVSYDAMRHGFNISRIFRNIAFKFRFARDNPTYFHPDGLFVFCGGQGTGKSLSAVNYVYKLLKLYPNCILVTNLDLKHYPVDNKRVFYFDNADDLKRYNNGKEGVIFLIDEIHLYFNSLESKNINIDVMTQIAQQRKQRKHIVATCQVFGRMAKPLREQFSSVILCKCYFGLIQKNMLIDRDSMEGEESTGTNLKGKVLKSFWSIRHPKHFARYDTYRIINNDKLMVSKDGQQIYGTEVQDGS